MWRLLLQEVFWVQLREPLALHDGLADATEYYREHLKDCAFDQIIVCSEYEWSVEAAIYRMKYDRIREESEVFMPLLSGAMSYLRIRTWVDEEFICTWVPIGMMRFFARGFNQSAILAKSLAKREQLTTLRTLTRTGSWKHQARLTAEERMNNVVWKFRARKNIQKSVVGRHLILIDDVISTGSTANECAKILKEMWAREVTGIFLARSRILNSSL